MALGVRSAEPAAVSQGSSAVHDTVNERSTFDWIRDKMTSTNNTNSTVEPTTARPPIAVIGIGCRFPGGVDGPRAFWDLLVAGADAVGAIPPDRFDVDRYYDPLPATPGRLVSREGGFLDDIDRFDATFFELPAREANRLDPQQRLLLETAWEALEDAGQTVDAVQSRTTGVFVGLWTQDYEALLFQDADAVDFNATVGSGIYAASGRLSYFLGSTGPSLTVNTHCASSLVAVHLACRSIWSGECDMALAGGANVILRPHIGIAYSQSNMLSPDGRCKFGDARANGYVRSEGAGIVVLKPYAQAVADGDPIYALVQGSAVTNSGRSGMYLGTPAQAGQERLLRRAYADAGIDPAEVHYVEAHGTGTVRGDVTELEALGAVLTSGRNGRAHCRVGSVKTNIGHTEAAAGIAGFIKTVLMLQQRRIPASLHFALENPRVNWAEHALEVPTALQPWPDATRAVAGVSSFSIVGTNAHVVLTSADEPEVRGSEARPPYLLPLSAASGEALYALAGAYHAMLSAEPDLSLADVCYTASRYRTHLTYRATFVANTREEMLAELAAFIDDESAPDAEQADFVAAGRKKVAFIFPGYGSQWYGMARELLQTEPLFHKMIERCATAIAGYADWDLVAQLQADADDPIYRLDEFEVGQPAVLAIEIALAELWRDWGIEPEGVIGHSMGEIAAAYVVGALSLDDAMRIVCHRSQLMQNIAGQGGMALVALSYADAENLIADAADKVSVAAVNGPSATVLAGDTATLEALVDVCEARDVRARLIRVELAAHSPQLTPYQPELAAALDGIRPRSADRPIYSTVTGEPIDGTELDAAYWVRHFRQPVLYAQAFDRLVEDGFDAFVDISPHPILLRNARERMELTARPFVATHSIMRDEPERLALLQALGELYTHGVPVDWDRSYADGGRRVKLPSYPWQRQRYWYTEISQAEDPARAVDAAGQDGNATRQLMAVAAGRPRRTLLEQMLREEAGAVLRVAPKKIGPGRAFRALGFDSLTTVEFTKRLEKRFGLNLSTTLLWNYPTIRELAPYLAEALGIALDEAETVTAAESRPDTTESYTEEDVTALIDALSTQLDTESDASTADLEMLLADELAEIDELLKGD